MAKIIQIDFKKVDERVIHYLKEKKRLKQISSGDVIALLLAMEGATFPSIPERITEPNEQVDYEKIYASFLSQRNPLCMIFAKFEQWFKISRIVNGVKPETTHVKMELAKILTNFARQAEI